MMSFLDLSTASEEERRLINEILSDTSVVNIAEPPPTVQQQQQPQQKQQYQQQQHHQSNRLQQQQQQPSNKTTTRPLKQQHHQHLPDQNHHHHNHHNQQHHNIHRSHLNQNSHATGINNQANNTGSHANNYVQNDVDPELGDQRLQVPPNVPVNEMNSTSPVMVASGLESSSLNSGSNDIGASSNRTNNNLGYKNHLQPSAAAAAYPLASHDTSSDTTTRTGTGKPAAPYHTSLPDTLTTNSVTQSTNTAMPPHSAATQMPPPMAGDMNSVMGMDMTSPQPAGYAMPPMPQTHSYGPPHVYGGPPIFQHYPTHYIIPYANLQPYAMPFVTMPPTNSVVPNRQQVANQSSQPTNVSINQRPLPHHPRPNRPKDYSKQHTQMQNHYQNHGQHQHQHQHQHHDQEHHHLHHHPQQHNQHHHQQQQQQQHQQQQNQQQLIQSMSPQVDVVEGTDSVNHTTEDLPTKDSYISATNNENGSSEQDILVTETQLDQQTEQSQEIKMSADLPQPQRADETIKLVNNGIPDVQSSENNSKHSNESCAEMIDEKVLTQKQESNDAPTNQPEGQQSGDIATTDEPKNSTANNAKAKAASGPWGSASSKSWASLFKADGTAYRGSSVNGETEHNTIMDSDNSEEEGPKNHVTGSARLETTVKNTTASTKEQRSQDAARRALDKMGPKLAQKISSLSLKHALPVLRPRGFINKGNGCYINSTLQALIACPPFYNLMKEIGEFRAIKRESSCTPILDSFAELFLNFPPLDANKKNNKQQTTANDQKLQMNYLQAEAIEPKCIYNVLGHIKSECLRGAQEDAEEFLSSVLNGLHEEMIGLSETLQYAHENSNKQNGHLSDAEDTNTDVNNDDNLWREVGPKNRSLPIRAAKVINTPIQEIFGGSLFSIRTAGKDRCGHRSPFFDLQLDISSDNVKSLQDAIKSFTATETIQDFYCSKTRQKLDAQRRTSLDQLPPILILHLKQFIYTQDHGLKKLMKRIEYPIDFELPESCLHDKNSDKRLANSRTYKLLAVVYHEGKEAVKGHYLTDVFHIGSSQWIRCDDSNLKVVPAPRIENPDSSRTPYLLFYRRLNTLGPRLPNSHDSKKKN